MGFVLRVVHQPHLLFVVFLPFWALLNICSLIFMLWFSEDSTLFKALHKLSVYFIQWSPHPAFDAHTDYLVSILPTRFRMSLINQQLFDQRIGRGNVLDQPHYKFTSENLLTGLRIIEIETRRPKASYPP